MARAPLESQSDCEYKVNEKAENTMAVVYQQNNNDQAGDLPSDITITLSVSILQGMKRSWDSRLALTPDTRDTGFHNGQGPHPHPDLDKLVAVFSLPNLLISAVSRLDLEVSDPPRAWGRRHWANTTGHARMCHLGLLPWAECFS